MKSKNLHVGNNENAAEAVGVGWMRAFWPALTWAFVLFLASSLPGAALPAVDLPGADKLVHAALYAVLGAAAARGMVLRSARATPPLGRAAPRFLWMTIWLGGLGLASLYGVVDELHQAFVPNRSPDVWDLVADVLGAAMGAAIVAVVGAIRTRDASPRPVA